MKAGYYTVLLVQVTTFMSKETLIKSSLRAIYE